jgi:lipopolysaccharide/colanic/teichoic acid biosynthesis glycosyltransferase
MHIGNKYPAGYTEELDSYHRFVSSRPTWNDGVMEFAKVLGKLIGRAPSTQSTEETFLASTRHFRSAMERERLRSDRTSTCLSLLTLALAKGSASNTAYATLARVLERRLRSTDTAGWLENHKIGIILHDTPATGAWKLADDLQRAFQEVNLSVRFEVYVYPSFGPTDQQVFDAAAHPDIAASAPTPPIYQLEMLFVQKLPAWKRLIDIAGASAGLAVAFPLMILTSLAIKITSRGPVFYAQQRDGLGGRKFWIYKFRTMVVNAAAIQAELRPMNEQDGPAFKLKNDPRVTPIGRLLRRTCIDELPQLLNVLKGDMSLVGPRPLPCDESSRCDSWARRRLDVTPGLTCTWQVHGGTKVTFTEWMRMDLRYACSRTLLGDLRLMILTVPSVVQRDGVY